MVVTTLLPSSGLVDDTIDGCSLTHTGNHVTSDGMRTLRGLKRRISFKSTLKAYSIALMILTDFIILSI